MNRKRVRVRGSGIGGSLELWVMGGGDLRVIERGGGKG